jgi:hypothetical protein
MGHATVLDDVDEDRDGVNSFDCSWGPVHHGQHHGIHRGQRHEAKVVQVNGHELRDSRGASVT